MLQSVTLYRVIQIGSRWVDYANDFVDYVVSDQYFADKTEAEFKKSLHDDRTSIEVNTFAYDTEKKEYFEMIVAPRLTIANIGTNLQFEQFKKERQDEALSKAKYEQEKTALMEKLTDYEKSLLGLTK